MTLILRTYVLMCMCTHAHASFSSSASICLLLGGQLNPSWPALTRGCAYVKVCQVKVHDHGLCMFIAASGAFDIQHETVLVGLAAQPSQLVQRKCGEADIQYSDLQQQHRGILAENRPPGLDLKQLGCHGRSLLSTELPYTSRNNLHVIPLAHALCYGVMKDFLKYLCGSQKSGKAPGSQGILSSAAKKVMRQRAADIVPTLDFNRPYRDVLQSRGEWVMEEYLHFIETWAVHILAPYKSSGRYYQVHLFLYMPVGVLCTAWLAHWNFCAGRKGYATAYHA